MSATEIQDLPAGRELDALVSDTIFGTWDESRCRICGWPVVPRGHYVLSSANGWLREAVYEIRNGVAGEAAEEPRMEVSRRDATRRCRGCGCEISITATYCGECMCEEDGV